jgi:hypothetical protein
MSFILAAQRDHDPAGSFERYAEYLASNRDRFPPSALALIDSDWYFGFEDHRAPHDSWLQDIQISEARPDDADSPPGVTIRIRLLGAYHDGVIELIYPGVESYSLQSPDLTRGHCDWRYDEFRISESGLLIHEIEWSGAMATGRWLIEARDVQHSWHPLEIGHH